MHKEPSPLSGKTVRIKKDAKHPQVDNFGGSEFRVEDWWDRVYGSSWREADGNPAAMIYAYRLGLYGFPNILPDDEVLYGKIGSYGHLVHIKEVEADDEKA